MVSRPTHIKCWALQSMLLNSVPYFITEWLKTGKPLYCGSTNPPRVRVYPVGDKLTAYQTKIYLTPANHKNKIIEQNSYN